MEYCAINKRYKNERLRSYFLTSGIYYDVNSNKYGNTYFFLTFIVKMYAILISLIHEFIFKGKRKVLEKNLTNKRQQFYNSKSSLDS